KKVVWSGESMILTKRIPCLIAAISCAWRQAHEIAAIRQGIRFVKIIDSPDQTTFFVSPRAKVFDVEIADRQHFRRGNQLGTDFRPNLYPAIESCTEERENPLSH